MVDLPERQGQPGAVEIGETFRSMREHEAELVGLERDRASDVGAENANVADRMPLSKIHFQPQ
jgi:hypothetical protein